MRVSPDACGIDRHSLCWQSAPLLLQSMSAILARNALDRVDHGAYEQRRLHGVGRASSRKIEWSRHWVHSTLVVVHHMVIHCQRPCQARGDELHW